MITYGYYACIAVSIIVALLHWRSALMLCVLWDALRDPIRKLAPEHPVSITLAVGFLWLAVFAGAWLSDQPQLAALTHLYPRLRKAFLLLILALVPAAAISLFFHSSGWLLAAVGGVSYCFPAIALAIGFAYARTTADIYRVLGWYCLINSALLVSTLLEYFHYPFPALGGIGIHWIRNRQGYVVELMSGFYRSPDLLGVHAAHVMMFGSLLTMNKRSQSRWLWVPLIVFAGVCLLLSGRRKMIMIPVLFAMVVVYLNLRRRGLGAAVRAMALLAIAGISVFIMLPDGDSEEPSEYVTYAKSVGDEGLDRITHNSFGGYIETIRQAGLFGYGLGTATQGSYHLAKHGKRIWQEDGFSRLGAELGLPGTILILWALAVLVRQCFHASRLLPPEHPVAMLQLGLLGVLAGNAASFLVSHQAYSGDPSTIAIAGMCIGFVLAGPVIATTEAATLAQDWEAI